MQARWPAHAADAVDSSALTHFDSLKELVRGVRNARTEYGLEQARKVAAVLVVSDSDLRQVVQQEIPVICLLAKLEPSKVSVVATAAEAAAAAPPGGSVSVLVNEGLQLLLPLAGLFDVDKELARLAKQKTKVEKELGGIMGRLNNPKFVEKASAEYIAEVRSQAADAQDRLSSIEAKLKQVQELQASSQQ
eukprot:GHUV01027488.1.p1 GENE.GHUV01027488.1~~GHUV01027488.1.p1  ORF type:complete len:191 (+),score=74.94 GHUV01027488.1:254-826(+)